MYNLVHAFVVHDLSFRLGTEVNNIDSWFGKAKKLLILVKHQSIDSGFPKLKGLVKVEGCSVLSWT